MSEYRVCGKQPFKGYRPGETFVGVLEPQVEARAVRRGSIEIVEAGAISLDATRAELPAGWIPDESERSTG